MSQRLVALRLPPGRALLAELERVWADGDAAAPLDPDAPERAARARLRALRPSGLVAADGREDFPDGVPVADGTALVVGTSSAAKAAVLSHAALSASTAASLARLGATSADRWLCCLPTHHIAGLQVLLRARALGTEPIVHPRFDTAAVAAARDATHVSLVPTMLSGLLDAGVDLSGFSAILLGGAAAAPELLARASEHGVRVVTTYGMTETCGGCVYDGRPLDGYEVAVGDDRRIRVRGPIAWGYRLRDDLTREAFADGWLRTADLGAWRDGRLQVHGRADEVVVSGGENIDTDAVTAVLREHPAVADAAAVGRDDPHWGEVVVAFCVRSGATAPSDDEIAAHVRAALGRMAAPKEVRWVAAIPRTALGKVRASMLMRDDGDQTNQEEARADG